MDGFVLVLAIIVFSVFRNVISEAKKKGADSFDTSAEHDEAQDQALDALRQWEARQRALKAGGGEANSPARERARIPRPGEHRTDVRLPTPTAVQQPPAQRGPRPFEPAESQEAEQTRRDAYNAIRDLLSGKKERPAPPVPMQPDQSQLPAASQSVRRVRIKDRSVALRPRVRGTVRRQNEPDKPASLPEEHRKTARSAPAGLHRLDSLPPIARGILYAELLGKPVGFRGPGEGAGD